MSLSKFSLIYYLVCNSDNIFGHSKIKICVIFSINVTILALNLHKIVNGCNKLKHLKILNFNM